MDDMMSLQTFDKRADQRSPIFHTPVVVRGGREQFLGIARNISRSGMYIQTSDPLQAGQVFDIEFVLPDTNKIISCSSEVKWSSKSSAVPGGVGCEGIEFQDMAPVLAGNIDAWVKGRIDDDGLETLLRIQHDIDGLTEPLVVMDRDYKAVMSNTAAVKHFGEEEFRHGFMHGFKARKYAAGRGEEDCYKVAAHDMKSAMTAMLGYSELLLTIKKESFDEVTLDIIHGIRRCSVRLLRMVEDLSTYSSIASRKLKLSKAPYDIEEIFREVLEELETNAHDKKIGFQVEFEKGLPRTLVDRTLVQRAITNLVLNAIKYTSAGGAVTVNMGRQSGDDGDFIVTTITDTGLGIPVEELGKVFDRDFLSSKALCIPGSGMGFAAARGVAESHGGRVEFETAASGGSIFKLFLPVK